MSFLSEVGVIVVGHGEPPRDLPHGISKEYFMLMMKRDRTPEEEKRFIQLEQLVTSWARTPQNDPYYYGLIEVVEALKKGTGLKHVWMAFNEFCRPTLQEALEAACASEVSAIVVVTVMMTRGGHHSEEEIPETVERFRVKCDKKIIYAWPFEASSVAELLARQVKKFLSASE